MKHAAAAKTRAPRATAAEVNSAIAAVRAYWAEGRRSIQRFPPSGRPRDNSELNGLGLGARQIIQTRRRAAAAFDAKSLEAFFGACRKAGYPPTSHLLYQLAMIPEADRSEAQQKALAGRWTANELASWRKARHRPSRAAGAGRRPKVTDAAQVMRELCFRWRQIRNVIRDDGGGEALSRDARRWADAVDGVMEHLERALSIRQTD